MKKIKNKILKLRKELLKYNYNYYNLDFSKVSDIVFDKKLKKLIDLEKKYPEFYDPQSPTMTIGSKIISKNYKNYKYKMYSIKNAYSQDDLIIWYQKIKNLLKDFSLICELKYDGVSINLIYKNGLLKNAITRGNGKVGEDVTKNITQGIFNSIPLNLKGKNFPFYLEIRGEIFLLKKEFLKINKNRMKNREKIYSNPRNTVSAMIRIKNIKKIADIHFYFIAFHAIGKNFYPKNQDESLKMMKEWGFNTPNITNTSKNIEEIFEFIEKWEKKRNVLPYQIDGIVIKINEYNHQLKIGYTNKYPKWAIAYKFHQNISETQLIKINFKIGRTGIITPVAQLNPISISGSIIKNVNLYNNFFIQKKGIHYGDSIFLEKSGDIIPKMKKINQEKRSYYSHPVHFIKKCPSCKKILIKLNHSFYCTNKICSSKKIMQLMHFVSENAMNIKQIGYLTIQKLYNKGIVRNLYDFFSLKKNDLIQLDRIKEKLANNILSNIEKSKSNNYSKVLYSLGIRYVGEYISNIITKNFTDIHSLMNANYHQLITIQNIGKKISNSILEYFSIAENRYTIKMLIRYGINFSNQNNQPNFIIKNQSFVFTGKLSCMTRREAKNKLESMGCTVYNSINNNADFLVVGKNFGSKLIKSFQKKNIKILNESHFKKILEQKR